MRPCAHARVPANRRAGSLRALLVCAACVVRLVPGGILAALVSPPPEGATPACFDYIDCSNVLDYVSLPALVGGLSGCSRGVLRGVQGG